MGKRSSYAPGTFSWVDLTTSDAAAAKSFYGGLFGWETEDQDAGDGRVYTMCRVDGDVVCGLFEMSNEMRAAGVTPSWTSYVTVADADVAEARAKELGGGSMTGAFDVLDAGRMAVLEDRQGAAFAVWQPRARIGAQRVNDIGCLCVNELATTDLESAASFYEALFGWTSETIDSVPDVPPMVVANNGGMLNASISEVEDGGSAHWRPYFTVESTEAAMRRVRELGGEELLAPIEIFDGSVALALDPDGAVFGLFEGEVDP